jgi:arylsulfatase A-like enzyme
MQDFLLITIDCLRADRLADGAARSRLGPNIDRLLGGGFAFNQTFAAGPRTAESFPAILTATYPLAIDGAWKLPPERLSLAQTLQDAGYATAAFHSNPFLSANLGYDRGFHTFWDSSEQTPVTSKVGARVMPRINTDSKLYRLLRRLVRQFEAGVGLAHYAPAAKVTAMALDWLGGQPSPFFLWIHYMDMHYPYAPPSHILCQVRSSGISKRRQADILVRSLERPQSLTAEETQMLADLYDAGLLYIDQQIGLLLDAVAARDPHRKPLIFLTGDHGEEFLEHGQFGHGGLIHLRDGGKTRIRLYDELLHVPLIVAGLQQDRGAREITSLASLVDIPPTAAALLDIPAPPQWQGLNLAPMIADRHTELRQGVFSEYAVRDPDARYPVVAYRTRQWKYIHDGASAGHELYDLQKDPLEQNNLYRPDHPALPLLQQAVRQHLAEIKSRDAELVDEEMDAEMVERLIGLGYLE